MTKPRPPLPEFNPLRFPPCECERCRADKSRAVESLLIRRLRTRVAEENRLRKSIRRAW
ncbi:hypothetical protein [Streptomyces sp. DT171]|uniref:hypothetical protein n=1 Tax=Streptomyces sp. DT171 TaxID=3416524 RepID=UPI003CF8E24A